MKKIIPIICLCILISTSVLAKRDQSSSFLKGKDLYENGKFVRALYLFSRSIEKSRSSVNRTRAYYYQGLALFEMGHYYSSYVSFRNVLLHADSKNKQMYEKAIKNAVVITDRLGMVDRVGAILKKLPGTFIATSVSHMANYAIGVHYLFSGATSKAEGYLKAVHPESQFYRKATLYLGILATKRKKYKDAIFYFVKVIKLTQGKRLYRDINELARLNLARSVYSYGNVDKSIELYSHFTNNSPYWLTILLEASWPLMRASDTTVSLGNLHTLTSPFYREVLVGEAYILRATILFSLCKYEEMRQTLGQFFEVYDPVLRAMQSERSKLKKSGAFYNAYVSKKGLNRSFVSFVRKDPAIRKMLKVQKLLKDEKSDLARYQRNSQMKRMQQLIEKADYNLKLEMDSVLRTMHNRERKELVGQREQANYLKVEVVTGEKDLIQRKKGLPSKRIVDVETTVVAGYHYWPYQGEYWEDELGTFVYTTASSCVH